MHKSASLAWISSHSLAWYCPGTGSAAQKKRLKAVKEAGEPRAVSESRILLGLVNYCGRFIPYLATVSEPLRRLTKSGTPFVFGGEQKKAFQELKERLACAETLGVLR